VLAIPTSAFVRNDPSQQVAAAPAATGTAPAGDAAADTSPATRRGGAARGGRGRGNIIAKAPPGDDATLDGTVMVMVNGKQESRNVTVGLSDGETYEVVRGLEEGDEVVLNKNGGESRWRGPDMNRQMMRGMGGGGRGR
jgi:HlyD family secretion protein